MKTFNPRIDMKPECRICSVLKLSVRFSSLYSLIGLIIVSKWGVGGLQVSRALGWGAVRLCRQKIDLNSL